MKRLRIVPLLAMILMAVGSAFAQLDNQKVVAKIPFEFRMGDKLLPAGEYNISTVRNTPMLVALGPDKNMISTHAIESLDASAATKLVFKNVSGRYFLSQIWVQGYNRGRELATTRMERELAKNEKPQQLIVLAEK